MTTLERREPELTELLLTEASRLHRQFRRVRLPDRVVRRLTRRIETLTVTLVFASALPRQHHADEDRWGTVWPRGLILPFPTSDPAERGPLRM